MFGYPVLAGAHHSVRSLHTGRYDRKRQLPIRAIRQYVNLCGSDRFLRSAKSGNYIQREVLPRSGAAGRHYAALFTSKTQDRIHPELYPGVLIAIQFAIGPVP